MSFPRVILGVGETISSMGSMNYLLLLVMITLCGGMLRLRFKYALKQCNQNEECIRADQHAKSLMNQDITSFSKYIRKSSNTRTPLASMIVNCTGEENISRMWQDHQNSLLNSVKGNSSKQLIQDKLGTIPGEFK